MIQTMLADCRAESNAARAMILDAVLRRTGLFEAERLVVDLSDVERMDTVGAWLVHKLERDRGAKIIASAKAEAEQEATRARESLRDQVAVLAVKGAEQILKREVNAGVHADILNRLKAEL